MPQPSKAHLSNLPPAELLASDRIFANVTEASAVLRLPARSVRRAAAEGAIPSVRVGYVHQIPLAWLREVAMVSPAAS